MLRCSSPPPVSPPCSRLGYTAGSRKPFPTRHWPWFWKSDFPKFLGDRLITAVELADTKAQVKYGYSEAMIRQSITEAREKVKDVPVRTVFNWPRLKKNSGLLVALGVGLLVLVFGGYALATSSFTPGTFGWKFADVSSTWAERNILLQDTPWPRRAHLEMVSLEVDKKAFDFTADDKAEVRIGKDSPAPKVKVRAYKWVIADAKAKAGWRPAVWADLSSTLLGFDRPALPAGVDVSDKTDLDTLEAGPATETLRPVFEKLDQMASVPAPRVVRKLAIPETVSVRYAGKSTRGDQSLTREANNVFTGDISGLQESVRFYAKGDDFATPRSCSPSSPRRCSPGSPAPSPARRTCITRHRAIRNWEIPSPSGSRPSRG